MPLSKPTVVASRFGAQAVAQQQAAIAVDKAIIATEKADQVTTAQAQIDDILTEIRSRRDGGPIVVVCSGQSPHEYSEIGDTSHPANLQFWNGFYDKTAESGVTGTAFGDWETAVSRHTGRTAFPLQLGIAIAEQFPTLQVYIIIVARGGTSIPSWLPGGPRDIFTPLDLSVTEALSTLGRTRIDLFVWWEGQQAGVENLTTYESLRGQFHDRLLTTAWMGEGTPVLEVLLNPTLEQPLLGNTDAATGHDTINRMKEKWAALDPRIRILVDGSGLDLPDGLHPPEPAQRTMAERCLRAWLTGEAPEEKAGILRNADLSGWRAGESQGSIGGQRWTADGWIGKLHSGGGVLTATRTAHQAHHAVAHASHYMRLVRGSGSVGEWGGTYLFHPDEFADLKSHPLTTRLRVRRGQTAFTQPVKLRVITVSAFALSHTLSAPIAELEIPGALLDAAEFMELPPLLAEIPASVTGATLALECVASEAGGATVELHISEPDAWKGRKAYRTAPTDRAASEAWYDEYFRTVYPLHEGTAASAGQSRVDVYTMALEPAMHKTPTVTWLSTPAAFNIDNTDPALPITSGTSASALTMEHPNTQGAGAFSCQTEIRLDARP